MRTTLKDAEKRDKDTSKTRFSKAAVLEQIVNLRNDIYHVTLITDAEMLAEYRQIFPEDKRENLTREEMTRARLMASTHYLTLVLGLE